MLLREMTSSALARSFKRFAQGAVAGLALAGLAACGGGGGGGSASPAPTTPEIPITPAPADLPAPTADQLAAATVISAGETISGTLESADDVKYYRLDVAERSTFEFTLDAEAGVELAILDSNGSVITTAVTASTVERILSTSREVYVRVRDAAEKKAGKAFEFLARHSVDPVTLAQSLFNIIRGIPHVNLTIGGTTYEFEVSDYFETPDGREVTWRASASRAGVKVVVEGTKVRLQATGEAVPGGVDFSLHGCDQDTGNCDVVAFRGTVARRLPTLSDVSCTRTVAAECIHDVSIALGGTYTSRNVKDYFDYPAGTPIEFVQAATGTTRVEGWTHRIVDEKLVVTVPSDPDADRIPRGTPPGDQFLIYLSAVDPDGGRAKRLFSFTVAEEEPSSQPGGTPAPASAACQRMLGLYAEWVAAEAERLRLSTCTDDVISDAAAYHDQQLNGIRSGNSQLPSEVRRRLRWCPVDRGYVAPPALVAAREAASAAAETYSAAYRELERANPGRAGGICGYGSG